MTISAFDLFKIGIGPSSSHTGGPMTAAYLYTRLLVEQDLLSQVRRVEAELFGSLGVTGHGHGTVKAVILGLEGERPHLTDPARAEPRVEEISVSKVLRLAGTHEIAFDSEQEVREGLLEIWDVMQDTIRRGSTNSGVLPGGLHVRRRAARQLELLRKEADPDDHLSTMEWVTLFALAVNEENAAGGRVVTAPTNGAAGIIPAVLKYYTDFVPGADDDGVIRFLLAATAVGALFKKNASISGAEVGCQGEVGSACAMAA